MPLLPIALLWLIACDNQPPGAVPPEPWPFADRPALEVRVEDVQGAPIGQAWVSLRPDGRDASTDADGTARFPALSPGAREAVVHAEGFSTATRAVSVDEAGGFASVALSPLATAATLFGRVVDPYGEPVSGAEIVVDGVVRATSDVDGAYLVDALAPGPHAMDFLPPGEALAPWRAPRVHAVAGGAVRVDAALPGEPPASAVHVGSTTCLFCHSGATEPGGAWLASAHAQSTREPSAFADTELAGAFARGEVISLAPTVPGASVRLDEPVPGRWTAELVDAAANRTGPLEVVEVYGGHRTGVALAVDDAGERALLPVLWALADADPAPEPTGWALHRTEGWYDGDTLRAAHTDAVSFDLQCAGCHATGHRLVDEGELALAPTNPRGEVERRVGCEACHGPGSAHIARPTQARRTIHEPSRLPPADALQTCARCHEQLEPAAHPFSTTPAWPMLADGAAVPVGLDPNAVSVPAPVHWLTAPGSRTYADQVGELRLSPHRRGPDGFDGACEDCHDPHGSAHAADLRQAAWNNDLCTSCHGSRFPGRASEAAHAAHALVEQPWGTGTCVGCHLPRSGHEVRPDALSGAGELHSHGLWPFAPEDALAELDAAGTNELPPEALPVGGCVDCHLQTGQGPAGDPGARATWELLAPVYDGLWP